ncbi:MAG: GNAT family N-acetyltransferase [Anaerolineae bacterium]|nr:GNAT family N-acetyltransferase [Anaerolineae bacterium]
MNTSTLAIESLDLKTASDAELALVHHLFSKMRAERQPDDPPIPFEENLARWRSQPPFIQLTFYGVWNPNHTALIGRGTVVTVSLEENRRLAQVELEVLPEYRRQGLGKRLLGLLAEVAEREGRSLMLIGTHGRIPAGEAFMERVGGHKGLEGHTNQLDLRDLDRDLLQRWLDQAASLADDFELGLWEGEYPESQLEEIAALYEVMNSQPRGTLQTEDFHFTPEQVRQLQQQILVTGADHWTLYVRDRATGALAGFTDVAWNPSRPELLSQGNTGVFPQYRHRGLGRWLKAAMLDKVMRERPPVRFVRTHNADSNAAMLRINHELGFKPYSSSAMWQVETARALDYARTMR